MMEQPKVAHLDLPYLIKIVELLDSYMVVKMVVHLLQNIMASFIGLGQETVQTQPA
jgi:hypothetical protein